MMQAVWNKNRSKRQKYIGIIRSKKEKIEKRKKQCSPLGGALLFLCQRLLILEFVQEAAWFSVVEYRYFFTVCACSSLWHVRYAMRRIQHFWQKRLF